VRIIRQNAERRSNLAAAWRQGLLVALIGLAVVGMARSDTDQAGRAAAVRARHNRAALSSATLEGRVQSLTKLLALDAKQQRQVRDILVAQRAQVARVWTDGAMPSAYRVSATRAVGANTADRIRALLNDEQKQKFAPPPPVRDSANPPSDALDTWMSKMTAR
jgi:hypothetical protein